LEVGEATIELGKLVNKATVGLAWVLQGKMVVHKEIGLGMLGYQATVGLTWMS